MKNILVYILWGSSLVLGLGLLIHGVHNGVKIVNLRNSGIAITGTVISADAFSDKNKNTNQRLAVSYNDSTGEQFTLKVSLIRLNENRVWYSQGDTVEVLYNAKKPSSAIVNNYLLSQKQALASFGIGLLILLVGIREISKLG